VESPRVLLGNITLYKELATVYAGDVAKGAHPTFSSQPGEPWNPSGDVLTDGISPSASDWWYSGQWLGWQDTNVITTVQLAEVNKRPIDIGSITTKWLQEPKAAISIPQKVEFSISNDGLTWTTLDIIEPGQPTDKTLQVVTIAAKVPVGIGARYLRISHFMTIKWWAFLGELQVAPAQGIASLFNSVTTSGTSGATAVLLNRSANDLWWDGVRYEPSNQTGKIELNDSKGAMKTVHAINTAWAFDARANLGLPDTITYTLLSSKNNTLATMALKKPTVIHYGKYVANYLWILSQPIDNVSRVRIDITQAPGWGSVASVCAEATVW
jgi:hypothetical protein